MNIQKILKSFFEKKCKYLVFSRGPSSFLLVIALGLSTSLWIIKTSSAIKIERPYLGMTSGCEEEALFSVWKEAYGFPAYTSPWLPPFSHSYFGWLFYKSYGIWSRSWIWITDLDDQWLPTFSRFLTLAGFLVCIRLFFQISKSFVDNNKNNWKKIYLPITGLVFINPLFDWWTFTVRPDIWALAFELSSLLFAIKYIKTDRLFYLFWLGLMAFFSWSFRPTNISVLASTCLYLLLERQWRQLIVFVSGMTLIFLITIKILGSTFFENVFIANATSGGFYLQQSANNLISAATKSPAFIFALLISLIFILKKPILLKYKISKFLFLTALLSLALTLIFSSKVGSSANYYFFVAVLFPIFLFGQENLQNEIKINTWINISSFFLVLGSLLILFGLKGKSTFSSDQKIYKIKQEICEIKKPSFSNNRSFNLPWLFGDKEKSVVFGFGYFEMLKRYPEKFVMGTISQKLQTGAFQTLLITDENSSYPLQENEIVKYKIIKENEYLQVYQLKK